LLEVTWVKEMGHVEQLLGKIERGVEILLGIVARQVRHLRMISR
jgi:hypothetical protein